MNQSTGVEIKEIKSIADCYMINLPEKEHIEKLQLPLASYLDCALHYPDATPQMVQDLCAEAAVNHYASVFVNPIYVPLAKKLLKQSLVHIGTVVGFPLGGVPTGVKLEETKCYIEAGADEIDMVISVGMLKAGEYQYVFDEVRAIVGIAHQNACQVKVILETAVLVKYEKILGCLISKAAGADFVKTSTGFSKGGATVEDIDMMRRVVGPVGLMGVKAAGGIHSLNDVMTMLKAGANRIGTRLAAKILDEYRRLSPP